MAKMPSKMLSLSSIIVIFLWNCGESTVVNNGELQYCSFFNNRAPKAQSGLRNCTWYKENSCCMQQEIQATFDKMKPLQGASVSCQKYINYLMCYICAPNQNIFYKKERLRVCEEYCDRLYDACNTAILKGSVIRELYANGQEFCKSRRFEVSTLNCFTFDQTLDTSSAEGVNHSVCLILILALLASAANIFSAETYSMPTFQRVKSRCIFVRGNGTSMLSSLLTTLLHTSSSAYVRHFLNANTWIILLTSSILIPACMANSDENAQNTNILHPLHEDDVMSWAQLLSNSLTTVAREGLQYEQIQNKYDNAKYQGHY